MAVRLFVGNLAYDATEADLRELFAAVGPISYISLPMDRETGKPRGFAFVEFSERADAEEAIRRLNNQEFKGRRLAVNEARARDDRSITGPPRTSTTGTPRTSAPRSPFSAETSPAGGRDFGPDAPSRRRRKPSRGVAKAERGPKRPMYRRAAGPIRFGDEEDDFDNDDVSGENFASRLDGTDDQDTE
jgi:RNA recognition motif-containing protein